VLDRHQAAAGHGVPLDAAPADALGRAVEIRERRRLQRRAVDRPVRAGVDELDRHHVPGRDVGRHADLVLHRAAQVAVDRHLLEADRIRRADLELDRRRVAAAVDDAACRRAQQRQPEHGPHGLSSDSGH
jgi:hypothetical protein